MHIKNFLTLSLIVMQTTCISGMNKQPTIEKIDTNNSIVGKIVADEKGINEFRENLYKYPLEHGYHKLVELFKDMSHYWIDDNLYSKNGHPFYHRWNLVEHSIMVALHCQNGVVCPILDQKKDLCESLNSRLIYLMHFTGFIHDCGKAGQGPNPQSKSDRNVFKIDGDKIRYVSRDDHEKFGFEYIMHDIDTKNSNKYPQYKTVEGKSFNFNELFDELKLDDNEKRIVAVLVGSHKLFSGVYLQEGYELDSKKTKKKPKTPETFIKEIFDLATQAGLPKEFHNKDLVKMVCIFTLADLLSVYFDDEKGEEEHKEFGNPPARRSFAKPGWYKDFPNASELDIRADYCKKVLYGYTKNPEDGKGAIGIIDKMMKLNYEFLISKM